MAEREASPHQGHRKRLRDKFRENGLEPFTDIQALELLLTYGIPRRDTNPLAHALLDRFHDFRGVLEAEIRELEELEGVGEQVSTLIALVRELNRRYLAEVRKTRERVTLHSLDDICNYARDLFRYAAQESAYLICLNGDHQIIEEHRLNTGFVNQVEVSVRALMELALRDKAVAVVLAHNHLTTIALPSAADVESTRRIYQAMKLIGVELLDHVVVADDDAVSMRDSRYFPMY